MDMFSDALKPKPKVKKDRSSSLRLKKGLKTMRPLTARIK